MLGSVSFHHPELHNRHVGLRFGKVELSVLRSRPGVGRRYCATHQEMREAIARGLDGPGISPLDVMPQTWAHCPGFEEEMEHRRRKVEAIKVRPCLTARFYSFFPRLSPLLKKKSCCRGHQGTFPHHGPL